MKLLSMFLIVMLFVQAFVVLEVSSSGSDAADSVSQLLIQEEAGVNYGGILKKHHPRIINCNTACARRCSKSSRKNFCHRACKSCCSKCHCVPPGTYGNKDLCPCYAKLKTHGNKPKCP